MIPFRVRALCAVFVALGAAWASAQPFRWPASYGVPLSGGEIVEGRVGDETAPGFNPLLETYGEFAGFVGAPPLVYRDWAGNRGYRDDAGNYHLLLAAGIEELERERDFLVTLRRGWRWSDGTEITARDYAEFNRMVQDPDVGSGNLGCARLDGEPIEVVEIDRYRFRVTLPRPMINGVVEGWCSVPVPMHVFGPAYREGGAAAVNALWGDGYDPSVIVSGGPFVPTEIRPGERYVLEPNPYYREMVRSADGTPLPAVDRYVLRFAADATQNATSAITGQLDVYARPTLSDLRALQAGIDAGELPGRIVDAGADTSVDFFNYNFNHPDPCTRELFRALDFRRAVSLLIDRDALAQAATDGLGAPARRWQSDALRPFHAPDLPPLAFDPDRAVDLLERLGYSEIGADGVRFEPASGCRASFELLWNGNNPRRGAQAQVMAQTAVENGVEIVPRQVDTSIWVDAIVGTELPRRIEYDAVLWGLTGGDIDNPDAVNVFAIGANLNAWNKSTTDVEAWEILVDQLTREMGSTFDLDARIDVFEAREEVLREWLPLTPLITDGYYLYLNVGNTLPGAALDAFFLKEVGPGNRYELLEAPRR